MNSTQLHRSATSLPAIFCLVGVCLSWSMADRTVAAEETRKDLPVQGRLLDAVPSGYSLYAYDDCGIPERQPHIRMDDSYCWTFNTSDTDADLKSRSAVFSYKTVNMRYTDLDPNRCYVLAITDASDHVYNRVQSLWANGVPLYGPYALPKAIAVRRIIEVPTRVTREGKLDLQWRIHGEVNATVSIVELWATGPPKDDALRMLGVSGLVLDLTGLVLDLAYEPVASATVELSVPGEGTPLAVVKTQSNGGFSFPRNTFDDLPSQPDLEITASLEGRRTTHTVPASERTFEPVRYRPLPARVGGLEEFRRSLDGTWRIDPAGTEDVRSRPLDAPQWKDVRVPGQWRQQGLDLPQDQPVAMAREFTVPAEWSGYRVFLRFDAIHAAAHYWVNGQPLGYSENLFTPVEWEITALVEPGKRNRLDLEMTVATESERLSYSSGYAFHSLGGIDRAVSIFALPNVHLRDLHLATPLDREYRDADLQLNVTVENPGKAPVPGLTLDVSLQGPDGKAVEHAVPHVALDPLGAGAKTVDVTSRVSNPLKWNAEKPNLYRLALELKQDGKLLQRVERNVGFRQIEIADGAILINGVPVKLAGACRHETDPLTGRADTMCHGEEDVKLIKAANLNYIRTSHYPPSMELVEAADKHGVYLEVEAPFCWVGEPVADLTHLRKVLTPTSAMIDYHHSHPSVTVWSLANESNFNRFFEISHELVKQLDPTRPTTFNNPDPKRICDIANFHYPPMPYDDLAPDDPRPRLLGEYFFPVCHEQTDVRINPGLREFFGFGHSDPDSAWGRYCAESFTRPYLKPGTLPGAWSHIDRSQRVAGGAIWAAFDEAFYFPDGQHAGYAWHHGFWGIIDAWRRPKPEWWLTKLVFSPVWFPVRQVDFTAGQESIQLPVENRYSFTDLDELSFTWQVAGRRGEFRASVPPRSQGQVEIPMPPQTEPGEKLVVEVTDSQGELINTLAIQLGPPPRITLPAPLAGPPKLTDDGPTLLIEGNGFSLVFDKKAGDFLVADPRHEASVVRFPLPHLTRYDFGDLAGSHGKPYAVFPDAGTRIVDEVTVQTHADGIELAVRDHYDLFAGTMRWLVDKEGVGKVSYRYTYSGEEMDTREAGVRFALRPDCDEISWRRWSEWDIFPADSISRTEGRAKAFRTARRRADPEGVRPTWPWSQDQTELGTADFRSIKFNVYEAALLAEDGAGLRLHAAGDLHVRPGLAEDEVLFHVLSRCPLGQVVLKPGDELTGQCIVELTVGIQNTLPFGTAEDVAAEVKQRIETVGKGAGFIWRPPIPYNARTRDQVQNRQTGYWRNDSW